MPKKADKLEGIEDLDVVDAVALRARLGKQERAAKLILAGVALAVALAVLLGRSGGRG